MPNFACCYIFIMLCVLGNPLFAQQTAESLWKEYQQSPNTHPNIPNCSFAGVYQGEKPIPVAPVRANVRDLGAKGDGTADDTAAFQAAIQQAAGKGAVLIPAGKYKLSSHLILPSKTVLRGEGAEKTTLEFTRPLNQTIGEFKENGSSRWSWTGGLIWMGPPDTWEASGKVASFNEQQIQGWEYWRPGQQLTQVAADAKRGDSVIKVANAKDLKPGQLVLMTWENPSDASLLKHIAGHPSMDGYNWASATWILPPQYPQWQWPVTIESISGDLVTLAQPLRVDVRPEWSVSLREPGEYVEFAGVENLGIQVPAPHEHKHFKCVGWNGVCMNRAYNCWVKDVRIEGAENPVIFTAAKNCTAEGLTIAGDPQNHHSVAIRVNSHDNLVQNFEISGMWRVKHGINIEWLSSGNVYSKGRMAKGTFDSHRALSFDLIRTEITLANDADGPGGAGQAGPFVGARVAHWNVRVENSPRKEPGEFVIMPLTFPMGAFVGIQGAPVCYGVRDTVKDEKGSILADEGRLPSIPNLYEAQLKLRLGARN